MSSFTLRKSSILSRDDLFKISTDVSNFHNVFPKYFKSIKIIDESDYVKTAYETIHFLGMKTHVKTRHEIFSPDTHNVYILSGPLSGTSFVEKYTQDSTGSKVEIKVHLNYQKIFSVLPFFTKLIFKRMNNVFAEFITASENYFEKSILSK
ncbi:hypothetical protein [Nitrosopumilus sp.]|uniref:hypothetical protein n=1 Tax=Nitrosopumilus sp. TaxID=2024843 RepID=UPI00261465B8|nr:hypothetical protein [Nitrosopumilus sp.]